MTDRQYELGAAELEVLTILWEHSPCTVRQVLEHLHEVGRRPAYTTVLTHLTRLEQKGVARSNKAGIAYVYRPTSCNCDHDLQCPMQRFGKRTAHGVDNLRQK